MNSLRPVKRQDEGMSLEAFSFATGISVKRLLHYCRLELIVGASKHPLTRKWLIYPPAKLVTSRRRR
jgi:hypothetical protein